MAADKCWTKLKQQANLRPPDNMSTQKRKQETISKFFTKKSDHISESGDFVTEDSSENKNICIGSQSKKRQRNRDTNDESETKKFCHNHGDKDSSTKQDFILSSNSKRTEPCSVTSQKETVLPQMWVGRSYIGEHTKSKLQKFELKELTTESTASSSSSNTGKKISELKRVRNVANSIDVVNFDSVAENSANNDITSPSMDVETSDIPSTSTSVLSKFSLENSKSSTINKFNRSPKSSTQKTKYTPLEQQYVDIKAKYPDALLFVECGYKYRFFGQDAENAAEVLNIFCHPDHNFMTASIPTHRLFVHVRRLVAAGYKVGVVKQMETAALKAAGENKCAPFSRELSALYTKSTLIGEDVDPLCGLEDNSTCGPGTAYLMCVYEAPNDKVSKCHTTAIFAVQPFTGDVVYDSFEDTCSSLSRELETRLLHIQPMEVLLPGNISENTEKFIQRLASLSSTPDDRMRVERIAAENLEYNKAFQIVSDFYKTDTSRLQEVLSLPHAVISCLAGVINYLKDFNLENILKLTSNFSKFSVRTKFMHLSGNTIRNLEVFSNQTNGLEKGSLFWVMNQTVTKFGGRMLKVWLSQPLLTVRDIIERQTAIQDLIDGPCAESLSKFRRVLSKVPDLEKGLTSIYYKKCSVLEFYSVCKAFCQLHAELQVLVNTHCPQLNSDLLKTLFTDVPDLIQDITFFVSSIREQAVRDKSKTELFADESQFPVIVQRKKDIDGVMSELQAHRRDVRLTLRQPGLDYVTVMGTEFLIEVKNTIVQVVPKDWVKISSTKTVSRFHSPFIEKTYKRLQQLREQLTVDCHQAWLQFLELFGENYHRYKKATQCLAAIDCLFSLANTAKHHGYCRPEIVDSDKACIEIENGRHPMIQQLIGEHEQYVPNNTKLSKTAERVMIITGPNMGGKSSYIKQVALITLLAQIGSYVPADSAKIGIVDAIYTRMGASDEIYNRRSTFMVELQEAADIMAQATERSLVILDELGRGTSTHDGTAIAHATLDFFIQNVNCFCLFVTHYPMLAEFEHHFPGIVQNYHMSFYLSDEDGDLDAVEAITFLYQLVSGVAGRSYGLNVARLAGIPHGIIQAASHRSHDLENKTVGRQDRLKLFQALCSCSEADMSDILLELQKDDDDQPSSSYQL